MKHQPAMRAKMVVASVAKTETSDTLELQAVCGSGNNTEDNTYAAHTPVASVKIQITNKALIGKFQPGQKFYVDFTETK